MEKRTEISMSHEEIVLLTKKLASFKDALGANESKILDLILAKAGEIKPEDSSSAKKLSELELPKLDKTELDLLGKLTRAIDGKKNELDAGWFFSWTYRF